MDQTPSFENRRAAGRQLAAELLARRVASPLVYALPRGGVPVGFEIAEALGAPLDLLFVRKIGVPGHEEIAAASIVDGEAPEIVLNEDVIKAMGISDEALAALAERELVEIERRREVYLEGAPPIAARGHTAVLADDGMATGASMLSAIAAVRHRAPARILVAVPVAAPEAVELVGAAADEVVCLSAPAHFRAVGLAYRDFHQLEDAEVVALMRAARRCTPATRAAAP